MAIKPVLFTDGIHPHLPEKKEAQRVDWGLGLTFPLIIAGPCSVESEAQIHETVSQLWRQKAQIIRGGIWKPRTRPGSFEGIGAEGLKWLKDAGKKYGLPVAVEVANADHIEQALKQQIDVLWIGARTTANPFAVQEIADLLKGVDIPIMVKNPINPDLELWVGAIERLRLAGINKLAAIHRGFSSFGESKYRNKPRWEIPIAFKQRYPEIPLICDPSHIAGNRNLLAFLAQKAIDLNFDGLMIESHTDPEKALSDAHQQVTPEKFGEIIGGLILRKPSSSDQPFLEKLQKLRNHIDTVDSGLLSLLAERMKQSRKIGKIKKENHITIFQSDRWSVLYENRLKEGLEDGLSEEFLEEFFLALHKESIRQQSRVMNK